jgi:membrane-associated protease RseP (regulator of RpoE activity)
MKTNARKNLGMNAVLLLTAVMLGIVGLSQIVSAEMPEPDAPKGAFLGVFLEEKVEIKNGVEEKSKGAVVEDVEDNSPADKAGIKNDDVIIKFNKINVTEADQLRELISTTKPGDEVSIVVLRSGKEKNLKAKMGTMPENHKMVMMTKAGECCEGGSGECKDCSPKEKHIIKIVKGGDHPDVFLGVELQNLTDQLAEYFKVKDGKGVLVASVVKDSPAEKAGIKAGDIIVKLNDKQIEKHAGLIDQLEDLKVGDEVSVTVVREGTEKSLKATLAKMPDDCGDCCGSMGHGVKIECDKRKVLQGMEGLHSLEMYLPDLIGGELEDAVKEIRVKLDVPMEEIQEQMKQLQKEMEDLKVEMKAKK